MATSSHAFSHQFKSPLRLVVRFSFRKESFQRQLGEAMTDNYQRNTKKKSRNYPRRKEEPAPGKPKIKTATEKHKQQLE